MLSAVRFAAVLVTTSAVALLGSVGGASAATRHTGVSAGSPRLSVESSIRLDPHAVGGDYFVTSPVPGQHSLYTFGLSKKGPIPALINTASRKVTGLAKLGTDGFFEPGSRLLYAFNGGASAPAAAHGLQIIRGTTIVASSPAYGFIGMPLSPGEAAVVGGTDRSYPRIAETLYRYRGTKLLSQSPVCADVWAMAYLPHGDLIYALCRADNAAKVASVEIFRGAEQVATITDFANPRQIVVDPKRDLAYIASAHYVRVYAGTKLVTTVHTLSHVGDFIPTVDDVTGDVYYNGFRPTLTLVVNRSGFVASRHFPGHRTAVNERSGLAYFAKKGPHGWVTRVVRGSTLVGRLTIPHLKLRRYDPVSGDVILTTPTSVQLVDGTRVVATRHVPGTGRNVHISNVNSNPSTQELYVIAKAQPSDDGEILVAFTER